MEARKSILPQFLYPGEGKKLTVSCVFFTFFCVELLFMFLGQDHTVNAVLFPALLERCLRFRDSGPRASLVNLPCHRSAGDWGSGVPPTHAAGSRLLSAGWQRSPAFPAHRLDGENKQHFHDCFQLLVWKVSKIHRNSTLQWALCAFLPASTMVSLQPSRFIQISTSSPSPWTIQKQIPNILLFHQ